MPSAPSPSEVVAEVARVLREHRFRYEDEDALQRGVAEALEEAGAPFTREPRLDQHSRIDFIVHAVAEVGIEVKVNQSAPEVARQVKRYLKSDAIAGLVLVTTRRRHRNLDREDFEKPVEIVWLGVSGL